MYRCRICKSIGKSKDINAREMMFGTREVFVYSQCDSCASLQISEVPTPQTLAKHYPPNYYSFRNRNSFETPKSFIREFCVKSRDLSALGIRASFWKLFELIKPVPAVVRQLDAVSVKLSDRILDVGCGDKAELLDRLAYIGFKNLLGIDPFIPADAVTPSGARIQRKRLSEIEGRFDLIMFHHSFEHVAEPRISLQDARKLLQPGGRCLIRIPTPSSEAYDIYGPNWVQFDAPRHLTLISRDGMKILALECGFVLERIVDDSTSFQFTGSELYLKNIPLSDQSPAISFNPQTLKGFMERSRKLNLAGRGDQAAFVLKAS